MNKKIGYEFAVRANSIRGKLLRALIDKFGNQVAVAHLMDEAFGKKQGSIKALTNVLGHIERTIVKRQLPYELVRQKKKKGMTIGLYPIEDKHAAIITSGATVAALNPKGRLTSDDS